MKDTRKLSVIYYGCSNPVSVDYIHTVNDYGVYYIEANNGDEVLGTANELMKYSDNFVLQSDFGIIEVQNGEIVYNNLLK